jgi:predicted nucleic acid-binding protein
LTPKLQSISLPKTRKLFHVRSYGGLKSSLESRGMNLNDNDLWIAATALFGGNFVVTRDQAFTQMPGLQVEDWTV